MATGDQPVGRQSCFEFDRQHRQQVTTGIILDHRHRCDPEHVGLLDQRQQGHDRGGFDDAAGDVDPRIVEHLIDDRAHRAWLLLQHPSHVLQFCPTQLRLLRQRILRTGNHTQGFFAQAVEQQFFGPCSGRNPS
ncbi:hypothetical protein D3C73_1130700 [compost metagenome]